MDDLTFLETVLLTSVGVATYNLKNHVSSSLPLHNQIIPNENLKTQKNLDSIQKWTEDRQMVLNEKKTKNMIFNFSKTRQFTTDVKLKNETLEVVDETKLLGVYITSDLKWNRNTEQLVKDANKRMRVLHNAAKFTNNVNDLLVIYKTFIRSKLEQSSSVWHSSLSKINVSDLERVQKSACKLILKERYIGYEDSLRKLNIDSLCERREKLMLKFAKKGLKSVQFRKLFPVKKQIHKMKTRNPKKFVVNNACTERYSKSSVPAMQRLLNENDKKFNDMISSLCPVTNENCQTGSLVEKI